MPTSVSTTTNDGHLRLHLAIGATDPLSQAHPGKRAHEKTVHRAGCLAAIPCEGDQSKAALCANLTRVGEKDNYDYLVGVWSTMRATHSSRTARSKERPRPLKFRIGLALRF